MGGAVWLALDAEGVGDPFDKLRAGSSLHLKNGYAQDDNAVRGPNYATTIKFQYLQESQGHPKLP